ncbi:MAG: AMMECR1 domain-containing protein, partial [Acidobacteriaceae bacterium]|nr:AMMECR1 domain-containing protein [Acidobacteriaceae bacterium]
MLRQELLQLLLRNAILRRSATQPVVSRDGSSARWMLDSLAVTMQARGAELAADCLLELLERFEGRQIATFGTTAIPILQSIVLRSGGRYSGLLVRKEAKRYGSMRRIEGQIRRDEPVIVVDDSISSGYSMQDACRYLEQAGLRVEGGVALVRFGWEHGCSWMQEHGYHIESVYDVWEDLMPNIAGEPKLVRNPTKEFGHLPWSEKNAPSGLHPAQLAREVLNELFRTGCLLRPPEFLDRKYDSSGGAWVSVRDREEIYLRYARDGFWHFPEEAPWSCSEDIIRAAWLAARELGPSSEAVKLLERSAIAVTFFSKLEECHLGDLDNDHYGIVVCSAERPSVMGGALPRMPGIRGEWEQFYHAAYKSAKLREHEPYRIYCHEVLKIVEPGMEWHTSGIPVCAPNSPFQDAGLCAPIARRARELAISQGLGIHESGQPLRDELLPAELDSLYVTVYFDGKLRGCAGSNIQALDRDLQTLVTAALADERFRSVEAPIEPNLIAVSVSLLFNRLFLGKMTPEEVSTRFRLADQALAVRQDERIGLLLPFVAVTHNLDRPSFVHEVIEKAGITGPPFEWIRYDCATWLADWRDCDLTESGFRKPVKRVSFTENVQELIEQHWGYLLRSQREDGSFYFVYDPIRNYRYGGGGLPRSAHAAWALTRAARLLKRSDLALASHRALKFHLDLACEEDGELWLRAEEEPSSVSELAFTLLALMELPIDDARHAIALSIVHTLWSRIDRHGRIATHLHGANVRDEYQDYFPGQVLLALAVAASNETMPPDSEKLLR